MSKFKTDRSNFKTFKIFRAPFKKRDNIITINLPVTVRKTLTELLNIPVKVILLF